MAPTVKKSEPPIAKPKPEEEEKMEMSDEDRQLQEELNMLVERLNEDDTSLYPLALETLSAKIRASTTSMTSVPKPLKFMRQHYDTMKKIYEKMKDPITKAFCADVISVLAMTMSEERECLKYRLLGSQSEVGDWGHEYVRHLAGEISAEWANTTSEDADLRGKLRKLADSIVPYQMKHNAEAEACDLLMEIESLEMLKGYVDENAYQRVCLYLTSCVPYMPEGAEHLLQVATDLFLHFNQYPQAMRLAMQLNIQKDNRAQIESIFTSCPDPSVQKQLAFMLGRQQIFLELENMDDDDDLVELMSNSLRSNQFINLGRELDIMEAKTPEDVYKSHLENTRPHFGGGQVDSARQNLAASFVNGLVNAGFGQDKLLIEDGNKWLYKNKEHGMLSATASLGLILLWDVDGGLTPIDKYLYSAEDYIKSGALLACGIVNCGVRNECDPALALLSDYVLHTSNIMRIGAILGLGLAYAGSNRQAVLSLLFPVFNDPKSNTEVIGMAALACGLISVGSCNPEVTDTIVQTMMTPRNEADLRDTYARFLPLGLGLNLLGKQTACEAVIAALEVIPEPYRSMSTTLVEVCAYAGTGNVLKIQKLLHILSEHYEPYNEKEDNKKDKKDKVDEEKKKEEREKDLSSQQAVAVLGVALIALGEDIGVEMAYRTFGQLLRYCEPVIRRSVPLALGLISVSNPKMPILDTLSKFSHDSDSEVAHNAIFAMGLVGAGTNNARLAAMLRQLAQYHSKDPNNLFMVRLAQGLVYLGKGTLTLSPYHSDRQLLSPVALAGLLSCIVGFLDVKNIILGKSHYILYTIAAAIQPRMLVTFDEKLRPLAVPVRVGLAVDVVGQAGKPKTITGFQTHTTPVLLSHGERAELATDEYLPLTPIMEGFVILKPNPDFKK